MIFIEIERLIKCESCPANMKNYNRQSDYHRERYDCCETETGGKIMDLCDINAKINVQNADEVIEKLERINALLKELHENLLRLGFVPCCETETGE